MLMKKDGSYVTVIKDAVLLKDKEGKVVGALEVFTDTTELDKKDNKIQELTRLLRKDIGFHGMVGHSQSMQHLYQLIEKAAQSDATVLVTGDSGSGKELVAQAIHDTGRRREGPFVKINCAALNTTLIESELFGHAKGAFTGAYRHRKGYFEIAHGGDFFLDEIGELPLSTQAKFLRVLETKEFDRIGGDQTIGVDIRIIASTNQNLVDLVKKRKFRQDLFYRINVFSIHVPPLRERKEDLSLLVNSYIDSLQTNTMKRISGVTAEVMEIFMQYHWPGNVRELKNTLEYAFAITDSGLIKIQDLPAQFQKILEKAAYALTVEGNILPAGQPDEKLELIEALKTTDGNQIRAAKILGVHRMTVWNRMRKHGINKKNI